MRALGIETTSWSWIERDVNVRTLAAQGGCWRAWSDAALKKSGEAGMGWILLWKEARSLKPIVMACGWEALREPADTEGGISRWELLAAQRAVGLWSTFLTGAADAWRWDILPNDEDKDNKKDIVLREAARLW